MTVREAWGFVDKEGVLSPVELVLVHSLDTRGQQGQLGSKAVPVGGCWVQGQHTASISTRFRLRVSISCREHQLK